MSFKVQPLPPKADVETKAVLKQLNIAHRQLALLNGRSATIPNETILINTLALQEAKDSSAIENIITTHDELYKAQLFEEYFINAAAKEVSRYADALKTGFNLVRTEKVINNKTILTIHPFYDGNGRTGRILNILYLVQQELLDLPILYLSRYIIQYKADYYRYLQEVRDTGNWEPWLLYMLKGVAQTAQQTTVLIDNMRKLMQDYKHRMREELPKIYSQDLLNNLFGHPYTKIEFVMNEIQVSRLTAIKYLNALVDKGFLEKLKIGKSNFYMNMPLYDLLRGEVPAGQAADPIITKNNPVI